MAIGLGESFYWPGSAASQGSSILSSGQLKEGSLRFARGGYIQGGFPDGYLSIDTLNRAVRHIGSTWTNSLTHPSMLVNYTSDFNSYPLAPQAARWLIQEGSFEAGNVGYSTVTFPTSYDTTIALPYIYLVEGRADTNSALSTFGFYYYGVQSVTSRGFVSLHSELNQLASGFTSYFFWRSEGIASYTT